MSERTPVIAGNWKMFKTNTEAAAYVAEFLALVVDAGPVEIVLCPPFTCLEAVRRELADGRVRVAAQNMHFEAEGAYTGEVSAPMLKEIGVTDVVLGHSERRQYFCENDADLARKTSTALAAGIRPILCVGESDREREAGGTNDKLKGQLEGGLAGISADQLPEMLIAYEPIWAIGTGKTATPEIAEETIAFIRGALAGQFGPQAARRVRILYGGSVNPGNIGELMKAENIDGALVGGASLDAAGFARIIRFKEA